MNGNIKTTQEDLKYFSPKKHFEDKKKARCKCKSSGYRNIC